MSFIGYVSCGGPDYYTVTEIIDPGHGEIEAGGSVAYDPYYPADTKIVPGCTSGGVLLYRIKSLDTINNIPYQNVIYPEFKSIDSSQTNPYLYIRKIYFAKNVGIIKYYEFYPHFNLNISYSLVRYKVKQ